MLSSPVCPLLAHVSCFSARRPLVATHIVFSPESGSAPASCPSNKKPDSKTCCRGQSQRLCGATPLDTASLPRPLIDCQHSQASYASFTSSATRHLSPRPSGAHIIGFGPCRHHTIADSLSVRLPFSSRQRFVKLFLCYHRIFPLSTDFDPLFQIFRPIKPQRAPSAHPCAHILVRAMYIVVPRRPTNFPPCASLKCRALPHKLLFRARQHALSASATHLTREKAAGAENTCAKPQADQPDLVRSTKSCPTAYGMFCIE